MPRTGGSIGGAGIEWREEAEVRSAGNKRRLFLAALSLAATHSAVPGVLSITSISYLVLC